MMNARRFKRLGTVARRACGSVLSCMVLSCMVLCSSAAVGADDDPYELAFRQVVDRTARSVVQLELFASGKPTGAQAINGIIVDAAKGWVVTAEAPLDESIDSIAHVDDAGKRTACKVLGRDRPRGYALLECSQPFPSVDAWFANGDQLRLGQRLVAVSRVYDVKEPSMAVGILSAKERAWGKLLQTDARLSPAFYGSPMADLQGTIQGMVIPYVPDDMSGGDPTQWYDSGVAFAVPMWEILERLPKLSQGTSVDSGLIGVIIDTQDFYLGPVSVASTRPYSPASKSGLKGNDVIVAVNGKPTPLYGDFRQQLGQLDAGDSATLTVQRGDASIEVVIPLVASLPPLVPQALGVRCKQEAEGRVVVIDVFENSAAAKAGLKPQDQIMQLGEATIQSLDDLRAVIFAQIPDQSLVCKWQRGDTEQQATLVLDRIAGSLPADVPSDQPPLEDYRVRSIPLPDVKNVAWMLTPENVPEGRTLGLMVVLAEPGEKEAEKRLEAMRDAARASSVAIAMVVSTLEDRWDPSELDVLDRVATHVRSVVAIDPTRISVAGRGSSGAMAFLCGFAKRATFRAVATESEAYPRFRLPENEPGNPLLVMLFGSDDAAESMAGQLTKLGYATIREGRSGDDTNWLTLLLRLNRALQRI
jgi:S1-C subfamily serine protease